MPFKATFLKLLLETSKELKPDRNINDEKNNSSEHGFRTSWVQCSLGSPVSFKLDALELNDTAKQRSRGARSPGFVGAPITACICDAYESFGILLLASRKLGPGSDLPTFKGFVGAAPQRHGKFSRRFGEVQCDSISCL